MSASKPNKGKLFSEEDPFTNNEKIDRSPPDGQRSDLEFLQSEIDAAGSQIVVLDSSRTIVKVNKEWRKFAHESGITDEKHGIGRKYPEICEKVLSFEAIADGIEGLRRIIQDGETEFQMAFPLEPYWFLIHATPFALPSEAQRPAILINQYKIPPASIASEALRNNEEFLRRFFTTTKIFPWEARPEGRLFTYVGHLATELIGYTLDEWREPDFWTSHIHPDDRQRVSAEYTKQLHTAHQYQFEYRMIAKDGRVVWIHDIVNVQRKNAKPVSVRGFMIDVAEQRSAEDTPRLLGGRLIAAQEEERKHLARELHDDLNQRVALISIELEQVGQNLPSINNVAEQVKGIQKKIEEISTDIHRMSYQLHPSKLDHLGLASALNSLCRELSESRGLTIKFRNDGIPTDLPKNVELCVFRVAQEALQNAAKYSGASSVNVTLKKAAGGIKLVVSDNGRGFDASSEKFMKGLGFISMRERLRLVNGKLQIISARSQGTRIEASVPLQKQRNNPRRPRPKKLD